MAWLATAEIFRRRLFAAKQAFNRTGKFNVRRREFLTIAGAALTALPYRSLRCFAAPVRRPRILLRSSWQTVNIGDIGHTPGMLRLLEEYLPEAEVRLWPSSIGDGVEKLLKQRFPQVGFVQGSAAIETALNECDFLLHGSGASFVAQKDVERWRQATGKPFGVYGITLPAPEPGAIELLSKASFVFFRDSVSLKLATDNGCASQVMEFGPDAAFGVNLRNDAAADSFLQSHDLVEGGFLCVIPRLRYTPYWTIPSKKRPFDATKHARNEEMKEHDHRPLREAIIAVVRQTPMKVLVCPEDETQVKIGKELLVDPLPDDVRAKVVWRDRYWLTDEAVSVYVRSAGLFGLEMHSPIMCIGNGVPALVGRFDEQTSKGLMWRDIGLGDWLFDMDNANDVDRLVPTVLKLAGDPAAARLKAAKAREFVQQRQRETMTVLSRALEGSI
jgi:polysaccharide pyruvyl transferase WcaK-like protein